MEPIHRAALDGDVAAIDRLVAEDGRRLNALTEDDLINVGNDYWVKRGITPLMLAALRGHNAAVARLLALGADVGLEDAMGCSAVECACEQGDHSSVLALLLDAAGASIDTRTRCGGRTPFRSAILWGRPNCVALLIERGGNALDLDANIDSGGGTAVHEAAFNPFDGYAEVMQLLLQAGADPTVRTSGDKTALDMARRNNHQPCIPLLKAALIEPQRSRLLFKARALLDAFYRIDKAFTGAVKNTLARGPLQRAVLDAAPVYIKERVAWAKELPRVEVVEGQESEDEEKLAACVKYALGLEGGGIVLAEGQEPTVGMLPEVLVELLEMMVPKWDPARNGRPLGEGV